MIEILPQGNGFHRQWISFCGRVLWRDRETHPCVGSAWTAAKDWRTRFWAWADGVDHRQARCV